MLIPAPFVEFYLECLHQPLQIREVSREGNLQFNCWCIPLFAMGHDTVTDLADSCANPLFRRPQGSLGCLEKQNHPLSLNLVVWCAKIGPKTKKLKKTCQNTIIFDIFFVNSEVFLAFLVLGPILAHQSTKFQLSGWFCFPRHPWEPWGRLNSGVAQELAKSVTVTCGHYNSPIKGQTISKANYAALNSPKKWTLDF